MDHRNGKFARQIIELQNEDGTWGTAFHTLSVPRKSYPQTTEQALRRLKVLGFTKEDETIRRAVVCMTLCLCGERKIDDYWEKTVDWAMFTRLMLSSWIRVFEPENEVATAFAKRWANVFDAAFESGTFDKAAYFHAYKDEFDPKPNCGREVGFSPFYHLNLLAGVLSPATENRMLDHVISGDGGIYYVYEKPLYIVPEIFASRETSRYLAAIEVITCYESAGDKLGFVADWLEANRDENGEWDLGPKANDGVYFPLSDSWRKLEYRRADCTERIMKILHALGR